jgi:protein-disulfide isomerase
MRRLLFSVLLFAGLAIGAGWPSLDASAQRAKSEPELDEFEQRVRAYLLEHPEVIMEAMQLLQERQRAAEAENLKRVIARRSAEILNDPDAPVAGNPSGDATLVEFFDYNCPYCRRVAPAVSGLIDDDPDLRVVYKEFPILGPGSQFAARAALASRAQGRYLEFHEALMNAGEKVSEDSVLKIAREVGLDVDRLSEDMKDPAIEAAIARNLELANALGVTGTPAFVIGDHLVPGAVDRATLEGLIGQARRGS